PGISVAESEGRLNAVGGLKSRTVEREEIHRTLEGILDLERLTSRITLGVATPRDLLALRQSLERIPLLRGLLEPLVAADGAPGHGRLAALREQLDEMADVREMIARGIADDPPAVASDPGGIRGGFNGELDGLQ